MIKLPHFTHSLIALCATTLLVGVLFFGGATLMQYRVGKLYAEPKTAAVYFPAQVATAPKLSARAAVLFDPKDGSILFSKNALTELPLASITKLMTAEIVLTEESPETLVRITESALQPEGDWGLKKGDILSLDKLLKIGLIASSNDAMEAAAESLGTNYIKRMNEVATNLGLEHTHFVNPTGLDIDQHTSGANSTAYEVARLAALFYSQYPSFFELTQRSSVTISVNGRTLTAKATDEPLLGIPGLRGAKTGYTDLAGGNLVAIFDIEIGHPLVAVVLGSTKGGRFEDIHALIAAARTN